MELSTFLVLSLVLFLTIYILQSWSRQHGYKALPPGPTPIPVVGTPKFMDFRSAPKNFKKLSQKYGSVFTIWNMSEPVIILCGYETMKEGLIDHAEEFSERPVLPVVHTMNKGYSLDGPRWRSYRRFIITALRYLGMGKMTMETRVLAESKYLIQAVSETRGKPFNPSMILTSAVLNTISSLLFGEHFEYQDEKLKELALYIRRFVKGFRTPLSMLCNIVPALLKIPYIRHKVIKECTFLETFVAEYIKHHKETWNPESPRDFIDHYLLKIKETEHEMDPDFCDTSLLKVVTGLLIAGTDTTASTLKFSLVLLAHYPDVQAKVQQEIDEVTKSLRVPGIMDKPQMSYTNAVIHEIQRVFDVSTVAFFHATAEDVKFRGYTIPKGTTVIPFLTSVLSDPSQWETPEQFNPGHFLDEDRKFRARPAFMPFSAGKRACAGEQMARMELFLLLSALLQKFTFTLPPGTQRQNSKFLNQHKSEIIASGEIRAEPRSLSK